MVPGRGGAAARRPVSVPAASPGVPPVGRRLLVAEIWVVFALSLGAGGVQALVALIGSLTATKALSHQHALLVGSLAPGRPWLDLSYQLLGIATALAPVALVAYLMARSGESLATLVTGRTGPGSVRIAPPVAIRGASGEYGTARDGTVAAPGSPDAEGAVGGRYRPLADLGLGAALAAVVGGAGLGFYLAAYHAGVNLAVVPAQLPAVWWRIPVLLLAAAQNGVLEEVIVAGYLLHRLAQLGAPPGRSLALSAVLRGSYHLYQGFGGFAGNVIMGLLFGRLYQRWGRVAPLIVAHTLIDSAAFVGYTMLHGHVHWLP